MHPTSENFVANDLRVFPRRGPFLRLWGLDELFEIGAFLYPNFSDAGLLMSWLRIKIHLLLYRFHFIIRGVVVSPTSFLASQL